MPEDTSISVDTRSAEETRALARGIGERLRGTEVICLSGPLGAGKTTFAKGVAEGLGIDPREVTSPTFLLVHELEGRLPLVHVDAYRVGHADELRELGVEEMMGSGAVVLVEWPERVAPILPPDRLEIDLAPGRGPEDRTCALRATGPRHRKLLPAEARP